MFRETGACSGAGLTVVVDAAVVVRVGLADHLLDLLVRQVLTQVVHGVRQLRRRNVAVVILVEYLSDIQQIVISMCISLKGFFGVLMYK